MFRLKKKNSDNHVYTIKVLIIRGPKDLSLLKTELKTTLKEMSPHSKLHQKSLMILSN